MKETTNSCTRPQVTRATSSLAVQIIADAQVGMVEMKSFLPLARNEQRMATRVRGITCTTYHSCRPPSQETCEQEHSANRKVLNSP
jgi:hypothetical protein